MQTATLDRLGRNVDRTLNGLQDAWERAEAGDMTAARAHFSSANEACQDAHLTLLSEGAVPLEEDTSTPVPLELLDTKASRRLLDTAEFLVSCAKEVDRERGHVLPDGTPCGLTDAAEDLFYRLRSQILGPQGHD